MKDNWFSGDACKDTSSLTIKEIERKNLGKHITLNASNRLLQKVVVVFVGFVNLVEVRDEVEDKTKRIASTCNNFHSVRRRCIEEER